MTTRGNRTPLSRILVPASFSTCSEAALDYATSLANRAGASIELLHVRGTLAIVGRPRPVATFFADSDEGVAMERALSRGDCGRIEVRGRVEYGDLFDTITRIAEDGHFDLIVMGHSGGSEIPPRTPSDLAHRVARAVHCPVLSVGAVMARDDAGGSGSPEQAQGGAGRPAPHVV